MGPERDYRAAPGRLLISEAVQNDSNGYEKAA